MFTTMLSSAVEAALGQRALRGLVWVLVYFSAVALVLQACAPETVSSHPLLAGETVYDDSVFIGGLIAISCVVTTAMPRPLLTLLCGYWWPNWLRRQQVRYWTDRRDSLKRVCRDLLASPRTTRSPQEERDFSAADWELWYLPKCDHGEDMMPTFVGNAFRSADEHVERDFGIAAARAWPFLWLLIPSGVRRTVTSAHVALDDRLMRLFASAMLVPWCIVLPWYWWFVPVVLSLFGIIVSYHQVRAAVMAYVQFYRFSFDAYRFRMYRALLLPLPATFVGENKLHLEGSGSDVNRFLFRRFTEEDDISISAVPRCRKGVRRRSHR